MRNFVMSGCTLTVLAVAPVASGDFVVAGAAFGVAATDAQVGDQFEMQAGGVFDLPKAAGEAWTFGKVLYWDATAKRVTATAGTNLKIGLAAAPEGEQSADIVGRVRLNGSF